MVFTSSASFSPNVIEFYGAKHEEFVPKLLIHYIE